MPSFNQCTLVGHLLRDPELKHVGSNGTPCADLGLACNRKYKAGDTMKEETLFIDAFNRGKLLTKADCVKYLVHTRDGFKDSYLAPVSGRRTLLRMCSNLHQIYSQLSLSDEIERFQRYIVALAK